MEVFTLREAHVYLGFLLPGVRAEASESSQGDAMTWTCTICARKNNDGLDVCPQIGCQGKKPAGLSEEERAALPRLRRWANEMREAKLLNDGHVEFMTAYAMQDLAAARAPLEAELLQAHEREAMAIMERDRARKDAEAELKRSAQNYEAIRAELETTLGKLQNAEVRVRELEALAVVESDKARSYMLNAIAETESVQRQLDMARAELREARNYIDTQLAQAQKPAAKSLAGMIAESTTVAAGQRTAALETMIREFLKQTGAKVEDCVLVEQLEDAKLTWHIEHRPKPAAPAGLPEVGEPVAHVTCGICAHTCIVNADRSFVCANCGHGMPAASPPGDVSTENMDRVVNAAPIDRSNAGAFYAAAVADIRAAVERERERWEEACASLDLQVTQWASRYADRCKASSAVLSQAAEFKKERDAALAEVESLRKQYSEVCRDWRLEQDRANELARKLTEVENQRDEWKKAAADAEAKAQAEWARADAAAEAASADRRARGVAQAEVKELRAVRTAWQAASGRIVEYLEPREKCAMATPEETKRVVRETVERLKGELATEKRLHDDHRLRLCSATGVSDSDWGTVINKVTDLYIKATAATAAKRCPAVGMSDLDAGLAIYVHGDLEATGKKARELFTSVVAPAQPERKVQEGVTVWTVCCLGDGRKVDETVAFEPVKTWVRWVHMDGHFGTDAFTTNRHVDDLGKTWWWSDPSAKGDG